MSGLCSVLRAEYESSRSSRITPFKQTPTCGLDAKVIHFMFPLALVHLVNHTFRHAHPFLFSCLCFGKRSEERLEVSDTNSTWPFPLHFRDGNLKNGLSHVESGWVFQLYPEVRKVRRGYLPILYDEKREADTTSEYIRV